LTDLGLLKRTLPPRDMPNDLLLHLKIVRINWESLDRSRENNFRRYMRRNPWYFEMTYKLSFSRTNVELIIKNNPHLFIDKGINPNKIWCEHYPL
jgi:hypothetical protein